MKRFLLLSFLAIVCLTASEENINNTEPYHPLAENKLNNHPLNDMVS